MNTIIKPFIKLKDFSCSPYALVAYGRVPIPATMQTPPYYAISLFLKDVHEPVLITYETQEERDTDYAIVEKSVDELR
jgi:hypothetical protein